MNKRRQKNQQRVRRVAEVFLRRSEGDVPQMPRTRRILEDMLRAVLDAQGAAELAGAK